MTIDSIKKNQTNEDSKKENSVNTVDILTKQIKHLTIGMCVLGIATGFSIFQNHEIKEENEALKSQLSIGSEYNTEFKTEIASAIQKVLSDTFETKLEAANRKHKEDVEGILSSAEKTYEVYTEQYIKMLVQSQEKSQKILFPEGSIQKAANDKAEAFLNNQELKNYQKGVQHGIITEQGKTKNNAKDAFDRMKKLFPNKSDEEIANMILQLNATTEK